MSAVMHFPPWPQSDEREAELLRMVLDSPQWGGFHPFVAEFEVSFASYQHSKYGIAAFNGTVTLELALELLGIGAGDEVIVPAISFISTATAVSRVGAIPVFVDIGEDTYNLDPARVREAITPRTKAVMAVHFGGTVCEIETLERICREHHVHLIEDAAHAQGSEWRGKRAGSFGVFGSFSFQNGKVLCAGEGGMLVTSDESLAEAARSVVNCGRTPGQSFYEHNRLGTNYRLGAFQAAVLLAQFERLPDQIAHRTRSAALLKGALAHVGEIVWQTQPDAVTQNSCYLTIGRLRGSDSDRDVFVRTLADAGIPCTPFYSHTLYQNSLYSKEPCRIMECPVAESRVRDSFWFPHRVLLADEQSIVLAAEVIREALVSSSTVTSRDSY
jgi:dTDP-4-amino-4,6-dideoxygalactose transaminase